MVEPQVHYGIRLAADRYCYQRIKSLHRQYGICDAHIRFSRGVFILPALHAMTAFLPESAVLIAGRERVAPMMYMLGLFSATAHIYARYRMAKIAQAVENVAEQHAAVHDFYTQDLRMHKMATIPEDRPEPELP